MRTSALVLSLAALLCSATTKAQASDVVAPAGTWYTAGGSASRSGATATQPLSGPLVMAWELSLQGELEGEPLVWDEVCVVAEKRSAKERALHVFDLRTGEVFDSKEFETDRSLQPSIWNDTLIVRAGPKELRGYKVSGRGELGRKFPTRKFDEPISGAVVLGRQIVLRVGDHIERRGLFDKTPEWTAGSTVISDPIVVGDQVYFVQSGPVAGQRMPRDGQVARSGLMLASRATGTTRLAHDLDLQAGSFRSARIQVGEKLAVVQLDQLRPGNFPQRQQLERLMPLGVVLEFAAGARGLVRGAETRSMEGDVVLAGKSCFARLKVSVAKGIGSRIEPILTRFDSLPGGSNREILASREVHEEYLQPGAEMSVAGNKIYCGGRAFDTESLKVAWIADTSFAGRPIPAKGHVLVPVSGQKLVAYRELRAEDTGTWTSIAGPAAVAGPGVGEAATTGDGGGTADATASPSELDAESLALLEDGRSLFGPFRIDADSLSFGRKLKERVPLASVRWLDDGERVLRFEFGSGLEGLLGRVCDERETPRIEELLKLATKARDVDLLRDLVRLAESRGVDAKEVKKANRSISRWERSKTLKPDAKKVAQVRSGVGSMRDESLSRVEELLDPCLETEDFATRYFLLTRRLERDPNDEKAAEIVRSMLPERFRALDPFDARDWLEFVKATREVPITIVEPLPEGQQRGPYPRLELTRVRYRWRGSAEEKENLIAVQSENLLVISSADQPGSIARCLSMGELVCETLETMFGGERKAADRPLKIVLYRSRDQYLDAPDIREVEAKAQQRHIDWAAGHYDPSDQGGDGCSRMFLPDGEDAFGAVLSTFVHELTHHWVDQKCPLFTREQMRQARGDRLMSPGFWIVEGFAELMGEARIDPVARTIELDHSMSTSLDIVANAEDFLPWANLFPLEQPRAQLLGRLRGRYRPVETSLQLGVSREVSPVSMFYAQSAATCMYMWKAENGRSRDKLLDYLRAYYSTRSTDERRRLSDMRGWFGLDADTLGKNVIEFAKVQMLRVR